MLARVILVAGIALLLCSSAAPAEISSGLRGKVALFPARPICVEDDPCTKPARAVLLAFERNGRPVARTRTSKEGTYRVLLAPGRYSVSAPEYQRGPGVTPSSVRVPRSRIARVDLEIDTGLQ